MERRTFLAGSATLVMVLAAGCFGDGFDGRAVANNPDYPADDHERHTEELTAEIKRRDVKVRDTELRDGAIVVDYSVQDHGDDLAAVAMAFVERVDGGWGIDRLEAITRGDTDHSWYAEADWARAYLDGEIDADEYGQRISGTLEQTLAVEGEDSSGSAA